MYAPTLLRRALDVFDRDRSGEIDLDDLTFVLMHDYCGDGQGLSQADVEVLSHRLRRRGVLLGDRVSIDGLVAVFSAGRASTPYDEWQQQSALRPPRHIHTPYDEWQQQSRVVWSAFSQQQRPTRVAQAAVSASPAPFQTLDTPRTPSPRSSPVGQRASRRRPSTYLEVDRTGLLRHALERGHLEDVSLAIAAGADPSGREPEVSDGSPTDGEFPLIWAARAPAATALKAELVRLLLRCGADPRQSLASGEPLACVYARHGDAELLPLLAAFGADLNASERVNGESPLWMACRHGHLETVSTLSAARARAGAVLWHATEWSGAPTPRCVCGGGEYHNALGPRLWPVLSSSEYL